MAKLTIYRVIVFSVSAWSIFFVGVQAACKKAGGCITDITQDSCKPGFYLVGNQTVGDCCPGCVQRSELGAICTSSRPCAPGLKCIERECVLDLNSCLYSTHLPIDQKLIYPPTCNPDGTYAPVQCKGDDIVGRCFCSSAAGKRIFGISWAEDAQDMTCACSRRRSDLEKAGRTDVTLHCTRDGNYEPMQCDSGLCWCANSKTGEAESMVLSQELASQLPCYDDDTFGSQYLRKCESMDYATAALKIELAIHGTTMVTMPSVNCDYDGTYGVYQIENGIAYCSGKNGKRLGVWQTEAGSSLSLVNCNCGRDTVYYAEEGKQMSLTCAGNGNYLAKQQLEGQLYCVDDDGFPTTELKPLGEPLICGEW